MKRFAAAAAVAVGIHALLLTLDVDRRGARDLRAPGPEALTILLTSPPPRVAEPRRLSPPPASPLPAPVRRPAASADMPAAPPPVPAAAPTPAKAPKKTAPAVRRRAPQPPPPVDPPAPAPAAPAPAAPAGNGPPDPGHRASAPAAAPMGSTGAAAATAEPGPAAPVLEEAKPEYGKNPAVEYPRRARQLGLEGVVVLEVLVDPGGRVESVRLFSSSGHTILDESAVRAVRNWVFRPARRGAQAIPMWVRVPVRYALGPHGASAP